MKKQKVVFVCENCGANFHKWQGKCTECGEWNTITEHIEHKEDQRIAWLASESNEPELLKNIEETKFPRTPTGINELDRVLGGGIVPGSLILFGGEPGIGKSTLLLQISILLSNQKKVIYITGEESSSQVKIRAKRLGFSDENVYILVESCLDKIVTVIKDYDIVIIDSIQTLYTQDITSAPGSVSQIRNAATVFLKIAKQSLCSFFIVGHITKEGSIAGPKVLEHIVDTVLYFEGDRFASFRIIKAVKNRFGAIGEVGVFQMEHQGLKEVKEPSTIFIPEGHEIVAGTSIGSSLERTRAILLEIQSLVSQTNFGYPQRVGAGIDHKRLSMIIAVLEKKGNLPLGSQDIFVNIIGGLQVKEPGLDLAIAMAIFSSARNIQASDSTVFIGELGLTGEIRMSSQLELRLKEADKFGFKFAYVPYYTTLNEEQFKMKIIKIKNINEAIDRSF